MGFSDCDRVASSNYLSLKDDGEEAHVVFLAEPEIKRGEYKGRPKTGFVFPVLHEGEIKAWEVGQQIYIHLRDNWQSFDGKYAHLKRKGRKGSRDTTYKITPEKTPDEVKKQLESVDVDELEALIISTCGFDSAS